ncbi:Piso0_004993 [Millerozyma farinosa CBS 7064]|uniref:Piso0_004993 protein n=1 Tax=Pichia sorbitophila (strain ATCC MYA-4447 / BCRC 22081 / CBS 7064 / NBRC 10061 / NRRL Y-12695) TaxID=559304 RepID=G8Y3X9_PICSO|nr:Piso0_004993 [Millerozyma farinosa CBS 7064]
MLDENQDISINMQIQLTIVTSLILINAVHSVRGETDSQYVGDIQVSDYDFMNKILKFITNDKLNENELFSDNATSTQPANNRPSLRNPIKHGKENLQIGEPNKISSIESNDQPKNENQGQESINNIVQEAPVNPNDGGTRKTYSKDDSEHHASKPSIIENGHLSNSLSNAKSNLKTHSKPAKEDTKQISDDKLSQSTKKDQSHNQHHFNTSKEKLDQSKDGRTKKLIPLPNQMVSKVNDEFHNLFTDKTHKLFKSESPTQETDSSNGKILRTNKGILGNSTDKSGNLQTEVAQPSYSYIRNDYMFDQPQISKAPKHLLDSFFGITCALICIIVHI